MKNVSGKVIYIILYVDDLLVLGDDIRLIEKIKISLCKRFNMKEFGPIKKYLGIEIQHYPGKKKLFMSQESI